MNDFSIRSRPTVGMVELVSDNGKLGDFTIRDAAGREVSCPVFCRAAGSALLDGAALRPWSPGDPHCYYLETAGQRVRFGYAEIGVSGRRDITLNGAPIYLRGYIRGIVAHDHPNMTGEDRFAWHAKNIRQAKKYGFNLVRFHSTVPDEDFMRAADELGLLVHMEIGFSYRYDDAGKKTGLSVDNQRWTETLRRYRNAPSAMVFCIGNEMHNAGANPIVRQLCDEGRRLAPGKLILDNAGWGEFDRETADIFAQHIAYYFPFKHHRDMFVADDCWRLNGSVHGGPLEEERATPFGTASLRRYATPTRPVLAHEAVHYIEIPDYDRLNAKFDAFAAKVGLAYLEANGIQKPRYLAELPALIAAKGLAERMPDYRAASETFKAAAIKVYLERLRLSGLCGFEMLQLSDCLKYENKNGILDCFDDDKFIDPAWMRAFNDDSAILADFADEAFFAGDTAKAALHLSHFGPVANHTGTLALSLQRGDESPVTLPGVEKLTTVEGLQRLGDLSLTFAPGTAVYRLRAEFNAPGLSLANEWDFRVYNRPALAYRPRVALLDDPLRAWTDAHAAGPARDDIVLRDRLDDALFADLDAGRTVILFYHRDRPNQPYYWPGALDRCKPCIWDRGNNLGGIVRPEFLRRAMATGRYFDLHMQPLIEGGYKINLDHFPVPVDEYVSGVDKPVRDRMKGLIQGVKDFLPDDTLRNFCYLFGLRVGKGTLIVSTFSTERAHQPAAAAYYAALINEAPDLAPQAALSIDALRAYVRDARPAVEDVMNRFWEMDDRPVEDSLFWEEAGVDLSAIK